MLTRVSAVSERKRHARSLFAGIAADYDRWAQLLSFGQDRRWHDVMVETRGAGRRSRRRGRRRRGHRNGRRRDRTRPPLPLPASIGIDQSPDMLAGARERVGAAGLAERIELVEADAEGLPLAPGSVDALTHTYLLRYVDDPAAVLRTLAAAVRPGGMMASLDFGVPRGAALHAWRAYTRIGLPGGGRARRAGMGAHRPLPRPEHRGVLEPAPARLGARHVGRGGHAADPRAAAERGRRRRHLGCARRRLSRPAAAR